MLFKLRMLLVCSGAMFLFGASSSFAAALLDAQFASLSGDRTEVTLTFDSPVTEPKGYTIEQPARISLDLAGVQNKLKSKYHTLGAGNAKSMTVIGTKDRTRLIFSLNNLVPYSTRSDGRQLFITIGAQADSTSPAEGVTAAAGTESNTASAMSQSAPAVAQDVQVKDIDFRRGDKGDGQIVITFSSSAVDVDMSEQGGNIRLSMPGVVLPDELKRRLDVTDFATPVKRLDAYVEEGNPVVVIKPEGNFDYLAYQTDNQFTVSVEALTSKEVEARKKDKFPFTGEKLSLNFQDIEVRAVLQLIADFTGLNLVASDTVGGSITLRLQNVPWDQALELILKTKGLDKRKVGNVLLVAPADEIAAREKLELEANKQVAALAPLRMDVIQVNYAKAADVVALLEKDAELITERGFISSDERTNTISVRETADKLEQIRRLVTTWDIPVRQVLIEARIVRARSNLADDMGIQWGGGYIKQKGDNVYRVGGSEQTLTELQDINLGNSTDITFPDALGVDLGVSKTNTSSIAIGYGRDNLLLDLELSALESDGKGEIVAQPKIVTADRQTATIKSGEEIPFQEASSSGATSVSFKEAVLSLEVTPQITPDDKVIMDLRINQDNRGTVTAGVPSIETNEIVTQVLVGNGETVVLGGIYQSEKSVTITKTPFLGDIPYLGTLFRKTENIDDRSELLIFITPKLLKNGLVNN